MKGIIFLSLYFILFLSSCSPPKPDGSNSIGSKEDLNLINKFIHDIELKSNKDISHDQVLVSRQGEKLWVFIKTDDVDKDFYYAVDISDYDFEISTGDYRTLEFIVENLSPTYRYRLIMDTRIFGSAVDYDFYARSIDGDNLFTESNPSSKDLEKIGALMEGLKVQNRSTSLIENYGFSELRALEIARLTVSFEKIKRKRSLTKGDSNLFFSKLIGFSYLELKNGYKDHIEGDSEKLNDMLQLAASLNQVDPESIVDILKGHISF